MPVHAAVRALEQFYHDERLVDAVFDRWRGLSYGPSRRQAASDAGALAAIVKAMEHHRANASLTETACLALGNIVAGMDESGIARKQVAADSGAIKAVVNGMQAHVDVQTVQEYGCFALGNICFAADEAGLARKQLAADECAITAILTGMRAHSAEAATQEYGCFALGNVCRSITVSPGDGDQGKGSCAETQEQKDEAARKQRAFEDGKARKEAAVDGGALGVIVNAMRFHGKEEGVMIWGSRALSNITFGNASWREQARQAGARPQWLIGVADAMEAVGEAKGSPASKTERLAIQPPQPRASATARPQTSKRAPRVPQKQHARKNGGAGSMVPLPSAGPLWRGL